ncbi:N-acetylmuramoyl-L-alanine amidase [Silvibacterium bohemicum]|uniref:N-acetylmuramoyl-L-alanine amidase n=1 Tax=Silvibacterium bohemicum TaxID=1577686 RepID=A0A841JL59_9BACT|nr:N-acetylmuramoyl-L-alanine amidase [Silvibacterium bohemicum]
MSAACSAQQTSQPAVPAAAPTAVTVQSQSTPALPGAQPANVAPRYIVVLDAAHGGSDTGARFSNGQLEKELTLSFSVRLRSTLSAHGIGVVTTRESDGEFSGIARAEIANGASAAACILIHATATGSGVHLYTSSLAPTPLTKFMPWQTAQSAYVTQSLKLSSEIDSALAHAEIPVTLGRTSLQPMDSFACPAVAVEIAPLQEGSTTKGKDISDASYQKSVIDALTAAMDQWRNDWRQQP